MNVKLFLSVRAKCVQMLCLGLWVILFRRCKEVAMSTVGGGANTLFQQNEGCFDQISVNLCYVSC